MRFNWHRGPAFERDFPESDPPEIRAGELSRAAAYGSASVERASRIIAFQQACVSGPFAIESNHDE